MFVVWNDEAKSSKGATWESSLRVAVVHPRRFVCGSWEFQLCRLHVVHATSVERFIFTARSRIPVIVCRYEGVTDRRLPVGRSLMYCVYQFHGALLLTILETGVIGSSSTCTSR